MDVEDSASTCTPGSRKVVGIKKGRKGAQRLHPGSRMVKAEAPTNFEFLAVMADSTPVCLWPQYISREGIKGAEDSKWLILKYEDKWWGQIVQAERSALLKEFPTIKWKNMDIRSREIAAKSMLILTQKLVKGIHHARETHQRRDTPYIGQGAETEVDETSDSDLSSDAHRNHTSCVPRNKKKTFKTTLIMTVSLDGHRISVLNCLKPVAIRVDMSTHSWLSQWAPLAIQETCQQVCKDMAEESEASTPVKQPAPYSFRPVDCPTISGKVGWDSSKYAWVVLSEPAKAKPAAATAAGDSAPTTFEAPKKKREHFSVDARLPVEEYDREKSLAYRCAVRHWNENDKSKRPRIETDYDLFAKEDRAAEYDLYARRHLLGPEERATEELEGNGTVEARQPLDGAEDLLAM